MANRAILDPSQHLTSDAAAATQFVDLTERIEAQEIVNFLDTSKSMEQLAYVETVHGLTLLATRLREQGHHSRADRIDAMLVELPGNVPTAWQPDEAT